MTRIPTSQLTANQKVNLSKVKDNYASVYNTRPNYIEITKGSTGKYFVACEADGVNVRIVYKCTSHLNIIDKSTYDNRI